MNKNLFYTLQPQNYVTEAQMRPSIFRLGFGRTFIRPFARTFIRPFARTFIRPFVRTIISPLFQVGKLH